MSKKFVIKLFEVVKVNKLATREMARQVFKIFPQENDEYVIDFSKIELISRSFADELIKLKKKLALQNKKVKFENMSQPVSKMIELVTCQSDTIAKAHPTVAIAEVTTLNSF